MKLKLLGVLAAAGSLALAACATTPQDAPQTVYELEGTLTAAIQVATIYADLPSCGSGAPALCSDPGTVSKIQLAAASAVTAVQGAQALATSGAASTDAENAALASAAQAVTALTNLTSKVKTS